MCRPQQTIPSSSFPDVCTAGSVVLNYLSDGPKWQMFIFKMSADYELPAKYGVSGETGGTRSFCPERMNE